MTSELLLLIPLYCRCHLKAFCDKQYEQLAASFIFVSSCPLSFAPPFPSLLPSTRPCWPPYITHRACRGVLISGQLIIFRSLHFLRPPVFHKLSFLRRGRHLGLFTRAYLNQTPRLSLDLPQTHNLFKVHRCRMSVSILTPPPHNFFFL